GRRPNPYDYDKKTFRWIRGVADYDEEQQVWYVVYNPDPARNDRYGGSICLVDHPKLSSLRRNDVVLVEGKVDAQSPDSLGKPKFQIDHIGRCIPDHDKNS